jgi:hypothetical protein
MPSTELPAVTADQIRDFLSSELELAGVAHLAVRYVDDDHDFFRCVIGLTQPQRAALVSLLEERAPVDGDAMALVDLYGPEGEVEHHEAPLDKDRFSRLWDLAHQPMREAEAAGQRLLVDLPEPPYDDPD